MGDSPRGDGEMVDLGSLQYHAHNPGHIARRIRKMPAAQRNALRNAYQSGPLSVDWGDMLLSACADYMGWRIR